MNSDLSQRVVLETQHMEWEATQQDGVFKKLLSSDATTETALIRLEPDVTCALCEHAKYVEMFVVEGEYINRLGHHPQGSYLRYVNEDESKATTHGGCVIFCKINYAEDDTAIIIPTAQRAWHPGQGRLEVLPLYEHTALVKWPKNERFLPHKHWGGEEIFVLDGVFMDEHGEYPKGTWIRSPHLSTHYPFVREETIIFVKTGHL